LIAPPSAFLPDERVFVSLGVLKGAASLETRNYHVNLLDLSGVEN
jgi:anaerobic magnesium-protoporphyrin IX monomethyl ester cyclase